MSRSTHVIPQASAVAVEDGRKIHDTVVLNSPARETPIDFAARSKNGNSRPVIDLDSISLNVGDRLGRFEISHVISLNRHHALYKAEHPELKIPLVLKVVSAQEPVLQQTLIQQLHNEGKILLALNHANIPRLWDLFDYEGTPVLAIEYIPGESLANKLSTTGKLLPRQVIRIASEINDALEHLRQLHLVHRDVKPGNIMLMSQGKAKLIDFGLTRTRDDEELAAPMSNGDLIGSPAYMSPEQIKKDPLKPIPLDHRSDMYSLGVVMYECLAGKLPFEGQVPARIALRHLYEKPLALQRIDPNIPIALCDFVMRLLSKKPENRMADHADVRRELRALSLTCEMQKSQYILSHDSQA